MRLRISGGQKSYRGSASQTSPMPGRETKAQGPKAPASPRLNSQAQGLFKSLEGGLQRPGETVCSGSSGEAGSDEQFSLTATAASTAWGGGCCGWGWLLNQSSQLCPQKGAQCLAQQGCSVNEQINKNGSE